MPDDAALALPDPDFEDVLRDLEGLSRNHRLYFRIEIGRTFGTAFFAGNAVLYLKHVDDKEGSFRRFCEERASELADLGLSEQLVRQSLTAWHVVQELPRELVQHLLFSHVVELGRVPDAQTRQVLAQAVIDNRWNGDALRRAVLAVRAGKWIDADPKMEGFQPPAPAPKPTAEEKAPHAGRVVNRFEKSVEEFEEVAGQWERVPVEKLTDLQRERMRDALGKLRERLGRLEATLGGGR